jgi:hypothetical protein
MKPQADRTATTARNRLDHILPRSYLDGFADPLKQGQLSVFDLRGRRWFEASTAKVGAERGYYDYSPGSMPDQTADEAFSGLESKFPVVRKELIANRFAAWGTQREFLLEYAQMLRVRSRLFRAQATSRAHQSIVAVVEEVVREEDPARPGSFRTGLKIRPYVPEDEAQHDRRLRNLTITQMRMEMAKGGGLFSNLHWCLRITEDSKHPVITADQPVIVLGSAPALDEGVLRDPGTWVVFPVCREACLIGNALEINADIERFQPSALTWLQRHYFKGNSGFVYSPSRIKSQEESRGRIVPASGHF